MKKICPNESKQLLELYTNVVIPCSINLVKMNLSSSSNPENPVVKDTAKASSTLPDDMQSDERKTDIKHSSPHRRPRGRPPKDPYFKRTRKSKKAEELD